MIQFFIGHKNKPVKCYIGANLRFLGQGLILVIRILTVIRSSDFSGIKPSIVLFITWNNLHSTLSRPANEHNDLVLLPGYFLIHNLDRTAEALNHLFLLCYCLNINLKFKNFVVDITTIIIMTIFKLRVCIYLMILHLKFGKLQ